VTRLDVTTAEQMYVTSMQQAPNSDIFIGCAAVADFRVAALASQKIKKTADNDGLTLQLVKNPDIIASVAALSAQRPFTVGFAAETEKVAEYARQKLQKKNLNLICANDVSDPALGFNSEQNAITVYSSTAEFALGQRSKTELAQALISLIYEQYQHEKKH
jgi:phosphopantothenoylcysteine decarboxylase/phosphopantothenate--cysteine ligase